MDHKRRVLGFKSGVTLQSHTVRLVLDADNEEVMYWDSKRRVCNTSQESTGRYVTGVQPKARRA